MEHLCKKFREFGKELFCLESLQEKGQELCENIRICLLGDDDIIYLMKNIFPDELSKEYFQRTERHHPIWKSEAEYKTFFLGQVSGGELLKEFESAMAATAKYLGGNSEVWTINESLSERIRADLAKMEEIGQKAELDDKQDYTKEG